MIKIFNTDFEISLRIMLILYVASTRMTSDRLTAIDFICTYGKDFNVSEYNLNGNNTYRFSEYVSRRLIVNSAIKNLVLSRNIKPHFNKTGFKYSISSEGTRMCESMNNEYAIEFMSIVKNSIAKFEEYSDRALTSIINEQAISLLR